MSITKYIIINTYNQRLKLENFLFSLNFNVLKCATYQNRILPESPKDYIDDSFKIFSESGINCIRIPIHWESYEKNKDEFLEELNFLSNTADKYNILCIYDNHQWKCSSYLGYGIGFPNSLLISYFHKDNPEGNSQNAPNNDDLKNFWNNWWDRKLTTIDGKDGWDAQLDYLEKVVERVKDKKSTLGFEILNEPQVYRQGDFHKVGNYHNYILEKLTKLTDKTFFICCTYPGFLFVINLPEEQAKIKPSLITNMKDKLIYDVHPYPPSLLTMEFYKISSTLMNNIPMYAGEFNSDTRQGATINEHQIIDYINRLKEFSTYGCALWQWSFIKDNDHPAFNLTEIIDGKINPNDTFRSFINAIKLK
jgi:hypothetical protein